MKLDEKIHVARKLAQAIVLISEAARWARGCSDDTEAEGICTFLNSVITVLTSARSTLVTPGLVSLKPARFQVKDGGDT